jgi:hypothetical protein
VFVGVSVGVSEGVLVGVVVGVEEGRGGVTEGVGVFVGVAEGVKKELNAAAHLSNGVITLTLITAFHPPHKSLNFSKNG